MSLTSGETLNNRYRIVDLLGLGGFGAVYRAWDITLRRPCAIKENLDTSPAAQRQFEREAVLLANLKHPGLPSVNDHFVIPEQGQYLVMEFVEGTDLQELLWRTGGPLTEAQALEWIEQVCDALEYLHSQEPPIIHRDIKPANIKITPKGKAVLVDFGIAKVYHPDQYTTIGARAVTPGYSPLEQYGTAPTDVRTDVYALGATLYHMLTGEKAPESIQRNIEDTLEAPQAINPDISDGVQAAVIKAIQTHPAQRFQSIADFRRALKATQKPYQPGSTVLVSSPGGVSDASDPRGGVGAQTIALDRTETGKPPWGRIALLAALGLIIVLLIGLVFFSDGEDDLAATQTRSAASTATQVAWEETLSAMPLRLSATPTTQTAAPSVTQSFVEEFDNADDFTFTQPTRVNIDGGQVVWDVSRNAGEQYVYRSIPVFVGNIELTVSGRVSYASHNCSIQAGVGDESLAGVSITFGFFGAGCSTQGYVIGAGGVRLDLKEDYCTFTGNWLWIDKDKPYTASLTLDGSNVLLSVPGIGSVAGQRVYGGAFTVLYVGMSGESDWPECRGTIDSMVIEQLP